MVENSVDRQILPRGCILIVDVCCLFVSYLFRVGHSTDMCSLSLLQENLLGGKKESVSR